MTNFAKTALTLVLSVSTTWGSLYAAATVDVAGPTTAWKPLTYSSPGIADPSADQQGGIPEGDLVGNTTHPSAYMQFGDAGTTSLTDGTLAFRVRVAADSGPVGNNGAILAGIDVNADGALDVFVGVNNSGSRSEVGIYAAGTGANTSPSTTTISSTATTLYTKTSSNYNWAVVTTTNDPTVGTSTDIDGGGSVDMFLSFSIPLADLVSYLQIKGLSINEKTIVAYVVVTSTQGNSLNQDINGVQGGNSSTSPFSSLGAISNPASANGTPQASPSITSANSATFIVGTSGTFSVTSTGNPVPAVTRSGTLPAGLTFTSNNDGSATISGTPAASTGGTYALSFTASNGVSPAATQTFVVSVNQAPQITSAPGTTFTAGTAGTFTITTSGYPLAAVSRTGTLPPGLYFVGNANGTATLSGTPAAGSGGTYVLNLTAANGVGTVAISTLTVTVNEAPQITSADTATLVTDTAATFSVTTTGFPARTVTKSGSLPIGMTFSDNGNGTTTIAGTPAAGTAGTYPITLTATNGIGSPATQNFALTVTPSPQAPAITSASNTTFQVGTAGTFLVTASGYPVPTITQLSTLPAGLTFTNHGNGTGTLSGTPAAGLGGDYTLSFTASNGVGSAATQNSFALRINELPAITSESTKTFTKGLAGSFTVTTSGFPRPALTRSGTLPPGITFVDNGDGSGTLSGTPTASGMYPVAFTADNALTPNAQQNFSFVVEEAPAITSATATTLTVGSAGTFRITASGYPIPTLGVVGALPAGLFFTENGDGTATLSGTAACDGGSYPLQFTATNGVSPTSAQDFMLTMNMAAAITSGDTATFAVGQPASFTFTTTGYPAPELTLTGNLPGGFTFDQATGVLSGTPTSGGVYTITVTSSNGIGDPAVQTLTITINQSAAITSADHTTFRAGDAGSFIVTTSGFPVPGVWVASGNLPASIELVSNGDGTATISGTPAAGEGGSYEVMLVAGEFLPPTLAMNDQVNGDPPGATQIFTLTIEAAPAVTSGNSATWLLNQPNSFIVTGSGYPNPTVAVAGNLPAGLEFNSEAWTLSGTPTANGSYPITITVSNGVGTDAVQNFTVEVLESAAITSADQTTVLVGGSLNFSVTAFGFPAPALSQSGTLPDGVTFDTATATLSGVPMSAGVYSITFTASNGVNNDAVQQFTLTVNQPAAFTSANATTFTVGSAGSFDVTTTGFPLPHVAMIAGGMPATLSLVDNGDSTATLSGTPLPGNGGVYHITFNAVNDVYPGASAKQQPNTVPGVTQDFTLTIEEAPEITSASSVEFVVGNVGSFTFTDRGYPAPVLTLVGNLPTGMTSAAATGTLSGTPASGSAGVYNLTVTGSNGVGSDAVQNFTLTVNAPVCVGTPSDLVAWFPAEGAVVDMQGGRIGTAGAATYLPGKVELAFNFDGNEAFVEVPDDSAWNFGADAFTVQTWVSFTSVSGSDVLVAHSEGNGPENKWIFWLKNGRLEFRLDGTSAASVLSDVDFQPVLGRWYHVAVTRSGTSWKFYIDGVQNGSDRFDANVVPTANAPLSFGRADTQPALHGALDEIQIFSRALSGVEILGIYNASTVGFCTAPLQPASAVSRKTHGTEGEFDIELPLTGTPAVECRSGGVNGEHTVVVTFNNVIIDASVSVSAGNIVGAPTLVGKVLTIPLSGVPNAQQLTIDITDAVDGFGQTLPNSSLTMDVLLGDTTANKAVNATDISQIKSKSGEAVSLQNFRCDLNLTGEVNASDISTAKAESGTYIP